MTESFFSSLDVTVNLVLTTKELNDINEFRADLNLSWEDILRLVLDDKIREVIKNKNE